MDESYLCIDIGTNSIKVLEKDPEGRVLRWGILERSEDIHSSIKPIDPQDAGEALRELLAKMDIHSQSALVSLPAFYAFTATADSLDPKIVPALPTTFKLTGWRLSDGRYFYAAVPREILEKYQEICHTSGLKFTGWELGSAALANRFRGISGRVLVVDIDERLTTFIVINGGLVEYVFHSDFGQSSEALDVIMNKTREIARIMRIERVLFSNSAFNTANGLQKVSKQAFNGDGRRRSVRSAY